MLIRTNITAVHMGMTNYPGTHKPLHNSGHMAYITV